LKALSDRFKSDLIDAYQSLTNLRVQSLYGPMDDGNYTDLTDLVIVSCRTGEVVPLKYPTLCEAQMNKLLLALNKVVKGNASNALFEQDSQLLMEKLENGQVS